MVVCDCVTTSTFRQRWRLTMHNSSRKMANSSDKAQNSERGLLKSTGNRESYIH